jgi:hypothetical protein
VSLDVRKRCRVAGSYPSSVMPSVADMFYSSTHDCGEGVICGLACIDLVMIKMENLE